MGKVAVKISPSLICMTHFKALNDWLNLERSIDGGSTVGELLTALTREHEDFRPMIFDPDTGLISDDVNVVVNDVLLLSSEAHKVKLKDGDCVILVPIYAGG